MARAIDLEFDLPYTPEQLFEQGTKIEYIEAQAKALNHYNIELTALENTPEGGRATAKYEVEVDLPAWAKKIMAPRNKVTEFRNWVPPEPDGTFAYNFVVRIDSVPVEIKGVVRLEAVETGARELVHINIKAAIPIFGSKLEELVAADLEKNVRGETEFARTWMSTHV